MSRLNYAFGWTSANSVILDQNAASDQVLHCLLADRSLNEIKNYYLIPNNPKFDMDSSNC